MQGIEQAEAADDKDSNEAPNEQRAIYQETTSGFQPGSFLTGVDDQRLYSFDGAKKHAIDELTFYALGGSRSQLRRISDAILETIPTGEPVSKRLDDGTLIKGHNPEIYVVEQGRKRWIPDMETLSALSTHPLFRVSQEAVEALEDGPPVPSVRDRESERTDQRDPRQVMVVYGRNESCRAAMFTFLRALGLVPIEWEDAIAATGRGSPHNLEAVEAAMRRAQAVVVLLTPDDEARLKPEFAAADEDEQEHKGQPRQNVILEAGLAIGLDRNRTILVQLGQLRGASDLEGLNLVRMTNDPRKRTALKTRLATAGCALHDTGADWLMPDTGGDFESSLPGQAEPAEPADAHHEATLEPPLPPVEADEIETRIDRFLDLYRGIDQPFGVEVFREAIGVPEDQSAWAAERLATLVSERRVERAGDDGFYPASR